MSASIFRAAFIAALLTSAANAEALLNPIFQDHAVLQRDQPIRLWGTAAPNAAVTAAIGTASITAKADEGGHWRAELPALPAGGPYALTVHSGADAAQTVNDILIGDVYLCSGQSNMAYSVMGAIDAGPDVQVSANDTLRLMTVANQTSATPLAALPSAVKWEAATPANVARFSAACYFFARDLQQSVHVPLGLIHSSWPGANITAFMSADGLHQAGGNDLRLEALKVWAKDSAAGMTHWGDVIEAYWRQKLGTTPWTDPAASAHWPLAPEGLGVWSTWGVPALEHYTGHIWFRTSVTLTAAQAAQASDIDLGTITEEDETWVNGRFIASTFGYAEKRSYKLPSGVLHAGQNDILINDFCGWRGCGLFGPAEARAIKFADGSSVSLPGPWRYQPVAGAAPRLPWGATAGITVAYNAMIAPLAPYGLRGVLWYQGESNTDTAETYQGLLKAWMADWRGLFQAPQLPFLIVQLPDYGLPPFAPEDTGWARLREAQRLAVAGDANAALAVTIDIGDHMGLHPANKQEAGRRLALAARRVIYHDQSVKPGPQPVRAGLQNNTVTVSFAGNNGTLAAVNGAQPIGFELCAAAQTSCRFVAASIKGDGVQLAVPKGLKPTRVRYCWGDGPVCTLYDATRLPAVPFELAIGNAPRP